MKLIQISNNVLVNPECISYVEQRFVKKDMKIIVGIEDREFELDIPLEQFWKQLKAEEKTEQYFAG